MRYLIITLFISLFGLPNTRACTSAIVGVERGKDGRWLMWKHRDSGHPDNYVRSFPRVEKMKGGDGSSNNPDTVGSDSVGEVQLAYVALFNAEDVEAKEAWIGFNEAGFAVMNTATYNIPSPKKGWEDREGLVMTQALRSCRTLDDFIRLLADMPKPRGVQANFGAIDAQGNGAYIETDDYGMVVYPLDTICAGGCEIGGIATRTNFSLSGGEQKRLGHSRYLAENHLLDSIITAPRPWSAEGEIAAEDLIETLSRSLYLPSTGRDLLGEGAATAPDNGDVISRRSSCASVVIEGPLPGEDPAKSMIMWTAIGFPTLSAVEAVTLDSVPEELQGVPKLINGKRQLRSAMCDSVNLLRNRAFVPSTIKGKKTAKPKYLFNLDYLRSQIPLRRAESLRHYSPARNARKDK